MASELKISITRIYTVDYFSVAFTSLTLVGLRRALDTALDVAEECRVQVEVLGPEYQVHLPERPLSEITLGS